MPDRRTRTDLESALSFLCKAADLPLADKSNNHVGLAIDSLWNERGRRYRVVEVDAHGGERCPFGHAYAPAGELYSRLQFAKEVIRYAQRAEDARLLAEWNANEDRDIANAERAVTR